jgi:L-seryl-tRNA(Ser) seleniumtransferase
MMTIGTMNSHAAAMRPASYGHGTILAGAADEARKSTRGRRMIRERVMALGKDSIFNLTGLVRTFPLQPQDLEALENQFTYYTHFLGRAEQLALHHTGADPEACSAVLCNRVSAAMLAIMLGTLKPGERVLSLVAQGRSHPSVQQAVEVMGATFHEVQGLSGLERAMHEGTWHMLAITPLTPSMYHLPAADVAAAIDMAKAAQPVVFVDDAHMMARSVFYDEPVAFGLGEIDVAVWSLDKHVPGPRGAAIVGRHDLMQSIMAQAFQCGLEAQSGHYVAMLRGMEAFDPAPIRQAGALARALFEQLKARFGPRPYLGGPGVSFAADDFSEVVYERAGTRQTALVPAEIAITGCFLLLQHHGVITIPITGYPGAAPTFRLMMHPDGGRLGLDRLERAIDDTFDRTAGLLQHPGAVKTLLLSEEQRAEEMPLWWQGSAR